MVASGALPPGSPPCTLPEAVLQLFPQHFGSITSARRACRRGEIWLEGTMAKTKSQKCGLWVLDACIDYCTFGLTPFISLTYPT